MSKTFFSDYGFRILLVVVFLLSFIWMGTKRTLVSNSNNVADWLPETFSETKQYKWYLKHFPYESFVVVSWDGCTMDDDRLEMFAQKLVPGQTIDNMSSWMSGGVQQLKAELTVSGGGLSPQNENEKEQTEEHETGGEQVPAANIADRAKYFKSVLTGPRLKRLFDERYGKNSQSPLSDEQILERLDGLLIGPQRTAADGSPLPPEKYRTAMIITLNKPKNEKELRNVLAAVHDIAKECGVDPVPAPDNRPFAAKAADAVKIFLYDITFGIPYKIQGIVMGGPPVDNVAIGYEGERTLYRLAGICALIGFTISMCCLRSFRLTMFVFWTSILAAGISLAMVALTGSRCDAIMLSMPALMYVLAMSGAIHIINYYHDSIKENGLKGAAERAITMAWYPCFMASFTTAIGLGSLYLSHLIPIMKFGFYSAIGVMLTLVLLFFYLPSLLHFFPTKEESLLNPKGQTDSQTISKFWNRFGRFIIRYNKQVALFSIAVTVFYTVACFDIKTSVKMMRFYSPNAEIIAHYTELEETLGPLVPMDVVIKFDNSRCKFNTLERLRFVERITDSLKEKLPEYIGGVMSAATFAPSTMPRGKQGSGTRRVFEYALNGRLEKHRSDLDGFVAVEGNPSLESTDTDYTVTLKQLGITETDAARLRAVGIISLKELLNTKEGEEYHGITVSEMDGFRKKADDWEKEHGVDLWRLSVRVWSLKKDIDYSVFIDDVKNIVNPLVDDFIKERFPNEEFPQHPLAVHEEKKGMFAKIGIWGVGWGHFIKESVSPSPKIDNPLDHLPVQAVYTGMVPIVYKTQHELIAGLVDSLISSFLLIMLVMIFILKNAVAGFLSMLPNLFPVVVVFGFMGFTGILVDVGTMMTASVAMGIAVDDTIHYLTWFRHGIEQGLNPKEACLYAYNRCATAMTQTTFIGGLGLSAFAFSTFTPTQMFGVMMLAILGVALYGDLIFLPAILAGPAGRFFMPDKKKRSLMDLPDDVDTKPAVPEPETPAIPAAPPLKIAG
ncbi:MAG: MMPL family transporter [Planctomycetaceae bacterium]|jgi:predicted RND superfamily exporter protein|nr:MMPL family transporter [Planctomycetaceae bacterium]